MKAYSAFHMFCLFKMWVREVTGICFLKSRFSVLCLRWVIVFCLYWVLLCFRRSILGGDEMLLWIPSENGFVFDTFFFSLNTSANFNNEMLLKNSQTSVLPMRGLWKLKFLAFMHMKWTLMLKHWAVHSCWQRCVCKQEHSFWPNDL